MMSCGMNICGTSLFADDTIGLISENSDNFLIERANRELIIIVSWFIAGIGEPMARVPN